MHAGIPPPVARQTGKADPPGKESPPPCAVHVGRYGQQVGGMHPTGMQFLLKIEFCKGHHCKWSQHSDPLAKVLQRIPAT